MNQIELKKVCKKYTLTEDRPVLIKNIFFPNKKKEVWVLKNVSLTIKEKEVVGIVGENGTGKSTLLKIIAGITTPNSGSVHIKGRIGALIELGAGFQSDLTGKENVYLNGTLLGLTRKEIDEKFQEITEFADIGNYIYQPIRTYSSGMVVRLGFSIAVAINPNILLIDEVLAVGDQEFQIKSLSKINELKEKGKTIIIVSHNLPLIESLTKTCVWLKKNHTYDIGPTKKIVQKYLESTEYPKRQQNSIKTEKSKKTNNKDLSIKKVKCLDKNNKETAIFNPFETLTFAIEYEPHKQLDNVMFGIAIFRAGFYLFGSKSVIDIPKDKVNKKNTISIHIDRNPFLSGKYTVTVGVCQYNQWNAPIDFHSNILTFEVKKTFETINYDGCIITDHTWEKQNS